MNTSKSKNLIIAILVLALCGIGGLAMQQYNRLSELGGTTSGEKDILALKKDLFEARNKIKQLEADLAAAKNAAPQVAANGRGGAAANANGAQGGRGAQAANGAQQGGRGQQNTQLQAVLQTPEALRLSATAAKATVSIQYAGLFRGLGLPEDQLDKVTSLMADRQSVNQDIMAAAQAAGINPQQDPQGYQKLVADAQAQIDTELRATMGEAAFAQYQSYQATMPRRTEVASFQSVLTTAGAALTDAQAEALVQALAAQTTTGGRAGGAAGGGGRGGAGGGLGNGGVQNISAANLAAAATVLNPTQLAILSAAQQQQQATQSLQQLTAAAGGGGRGGAAGGAAAGGRGGGAAGGAAGGNVRGAAGAAGGNTRAAGGGAPATGTRGN